MQLRLGSEVIVRQLTRELLEKQPLTGYFRPYTREADETSALLAELNHERLSGYMFSLIGEQEADTCHYEHRLLADYCEKHGLRLNGPARLSLEGDALILQAVNHRGEPMGEAYRIPFVPKMGTAEEPAPQMYLAEYPEG